MKKLLKLTALTLVAVLLLASLVSCDKSKGLKQAYIDAGYTVKVVTSEDAAAQVIFGLLGMSEEEIEELEDHEIVICSKGLSQAMIIKFPNMFELKDYLVEEEDGVKDTSAYDKAKANNKIKGNCLLLYGTGDADVVFAAN